MVKLYIKKIFNQPGLKEHAASHMAGMELLARGLSELYGLDLPAPMMDDFIYTAQEGGKPLLSVFEINHFLTCSTGIDTKLVTDALSRVHFNISNTKGLAVCAFADSEVGVDIEKISPFMKSITKRTFTDNEQQLFEERCSAAASTSWPGLERTYDEKWDVNKSRCTDFYRIWTLKEAYLKQRGTGLAGDLRSAEFMLEEDLVQEEFSEIQSSAAGLFFNQVGLPEDYILSVCTEKQPGDIEIIME